MGRAKFPLLAVAALFAAQGLVHQFAIDPHLDELTSAGVYDKNVKGGVDLKALPATLWGQIFGFREVAASLVWIQAEGAFHEGDFQLIPFLCRIATLLDPHFIEVYTTGGWHMAYNFTNDVGDVSDRRYMPDALQFLDEGCVNNSYVFDVFHERAMTLLDKGREYNAAAASWLQADQSGDPKYPRGFQHQRAHALARAGRVEEAKAWWREMLRRTKADLAKDPNNRQLIDLRNIEQQNLDLLILRQYNRRNLAQHKWQMGFSIKARFVRPKVLEILGTMRMPTEKVDWNDNGKLDPLTTRVLIVFKDFDYADEVKRPLRDRLANATIMHKDTFVADNILYEQFDMSQKADEKMYRFTKPRYTLEVRYDPRASQPEVQDYFGFIGEGMTDPKYLRREPDGNYVLYAKFEFTQDEVLKGCGWKGESNAKIPAQSPAEANDAQLFGGRRP
jgi:hypothetical protein